MSNEEVYPLFTQRATHNYNFVKIRHPTDNIEEISLMTVTVASQYIRRRVIIGYRIMNTTFISLPDFYRARFKQDRYPELIRDEPNDPNLLSYLDYALMEKNGIKLEDCMDDGYRISKKYGVPEPDFNSLKQICDYIDAFKAYIHSVRSTETITVEETLKRVNKNIVHTCTILLVILLMMVIYICFLIRDRL